MKINYVYGDSNIFIHYFNNQPDYIATLEQLFDEISKDRDRKIITSAFSIIEVAHVANEKINSKLLPDIEKKLDEFWMDDSLIEFIDFHEKLARDARTLMRQALQDGYTLKGPDALHLASAQSIGVSEFLTYDTGLFKYAAMTGFKIREPYIAQPRLSGFDEDTE